MAAEAIAIHGMGEALRAKGDLAEARAYFGKSYEIAYAMKSQYLEFVCLLDEALLAMDRHEEAMSLSLLHKALPLGREQGYVNMHFWRPASMIRICQVALENGIEVDYVKKLIRQRHLRPENPLQHIENWPWTLKLRTLGAFEMMTDDGPVSFTGKVQKKPLDLLKALIAFGSKEVSETRLTDELWPDADDLLEEFYQRLMVCYQARRQTAEAVKTYQRCRSVLSAHLAIGPSPETEAI